jgi:hypothetical protein
VRLTLKGQLIIVFNTSNNRRAILQDNLPWMQRVLCYEELGIMATPSTNIDEKRIIINYFKSFN